MLHFAAYVETAHIFLLLCLTLSPSGKVQSVVSLEQRKAVIMRNANVVCKSATGTVNTVAALCALHTCVCSYYSHCGACLVCQLHMRDLLHNRRGHCVYSHSHGRKQELSSGLLRSRLSGQVGHVKWR